MAVHAHDQHVPSDEYAGILNLTAPGRCSRLHPAQLGFPCSHIQHSLWISPCRENGALVVIHEAMPSKAPCCIDMFMQLRMPCFVWEKPQSPSSIPIMHRSRCTLVTSNMGAQMPTSSLRSRAKREYCTVLCTPPCPASPWSRHWLPLTINPLPTCVR